MNIIVCSVTFLDTTAITSTTATDTSARVETERVFMTIFYFMKKNIFVFWSPASQKTIILSKPVRLLDHFFVRLGQFYL